MKKALLLAAFGATLLAGCGGDDGDKTSGTSSSSSSKAKPTTAIEISNFLYKPNPSVVKAGTKVSIANDDDAPHTVTDKGTPRAFDSGTIKGKKDGSVTFSKAGKYAYFCEFHPTMAGKVTVTE